MKTIQLGFLALFCLSMASCTKDIDALASGSSSQNASEPQPYNRFVDPNSPANNGNGNGNGNGNPNIQLADANPTMAIAFNPDPATEGQQVTVRGYLAPAAGETAPACGKLQIQMWDGTTFIGVGSTVDVSASTTEVSYTFTPTAVGDDAYTFRVHFIKGGCDGYANTFSDAVTLDVLRACAYELKGWVEGHPQPVANEPGMYMFTVKYQVETCEIQFDQFKIQGGLTNGVSVISSNGGTGNLGGWIPGTSTNSIINWKESTPGSPLSNALRTYEITFKRAWNGGPVTVTGSWSAKATWMGSVVGDMEIDPLVYTP